MNNLSIRPLKKGENLPLALLLSADPSEVAIQLYLPDSTVFVAEINNQVIGEYVLYRINAQEVEIKNIAVDEVYQGKGIGKFLLNDAARQATNQGFSRLTIGTSNASIAQLYLYQKHGFEIYSIKYNFFVDNYAEPIFENGIQCKHMIMLSKTLN